MIKTASSSSSSGSGNRSVIEPSNRMVLQPSRMEIVYNRTSRDFERLKSELARLETFDLPPGWPVQFIRSDDCAKAGFFFLQDGDKVQCAFCRGVAGEWEEGDNPLAEHKRHFPKCPFVCNLPVGNIDIGHELEAAQIRDEEEAAGIDVCGPFPHPARSFSSSQEPASVRGAQPLNGNMNDVATSLAIKVCGNGPVHANLVTFQSRLKTFSTWPVASGQTSETLAEAGFFYIGRLDHVKCFYCDGGLRNWEPADDPWLEHARWFPNCSFVVLNKGDSFVKEVTRSKPPVVPHQYLNKLPSIGHALTPRRVSDEELRDLIDTPIVQAALELGMELGKVKGALQRKIQQTGQPFMTTEGLLEAVLGRDSEYESDPDTESEDNDEDEDLMPPPRPRPSCNLNNINVSIFSGPGSATSEASSSSSAEHSSGSGDEDSSICNQSSESSNPQRPGKLPASRSASGDSGVSAMSSESNSMEEQQPETEEPSPSSASVNNPITSLSTTEEKQNSENEMATTNNTGVVVNERVFSKEMAMEEELRKLREATQCKICMDNRVEVVFLPCGHLVSCTRCATALSNCAVCREPIKAYVKTYLS